ncbi:MAG: mechanosensitive ion channel protein MscL [Bdellovibrionales bacterium RIFCSPHIGHO2_01_FULL_40_29]|nr:MAG: mechanosensitive ion channel protein MscL [Bdellovibrionales bacterium RIFCSPHIGHO2_01_FULL_40_29]OFZ34808.1 MAG: mechanosensitive ion channel protein MscL [Bdellovibrionales bacterium RIFCSPHIGHO2_02_FULL_40_15]
MLQDFKKFIAQGNVMELAVGVIIAAAFGKIVSSLVNDIIMPLIGLILNGLNVSGQFYALNGEHYLSIEEAKKAGVGVLAYGNFLQGIIDFLIIAFVLFIVIKQVNRFKKPVAPPVP